MSSGVFIVMARANWLKAPRPTGRRNPKRADGVWDGQSGRRTMKIRWPGIFPGQVLEATMTETQDSVSRTGSQAVLTVTVAGAPILIYPPGEGVEVIEASLSEKEALQRAGYSVPEGI
jgi:hypothetical protein